MLTDHHNLKFLLEQRIASPNQLKWITKLMGYDFEIVYRKGKENLAVDVLSRMPSEQISTLVLNTLDSELLEEIKKAWSRDEKSQELIKGIEDNPYMVGEFS